MFVLSPEDDQSTTLSCYTTSSFQNNHNSDFIMNMVLPQTEIDCTMQSFISYLISIDPIHLASSSQQNGTTKIVVMMTPGELGQY